MADRKKVSAASLLLLDANKQFTLDEFLALVKDLVDVQINHKRLAEQHRERETAHLMTYWHREPYAVEHGEVVSIKPHGS